MLDLPNVAATPPPGVKLRQIKPDQIKDQMVKVELRQVNGKPVSFIQLRQYFLH